MQLVGKEITAVEVICMGAIPQVGALDDGSKTHSSKQNRKPSLPEIK